MCPDEKYAKLLALSVLYEKTEPERMIQVQRITCHPEDFDLLLDDVRDEGFKDWVRSVAHLFKS
jgi:spore coat protein CotH